MDRRNETGGVEKTAMMNFTIPDVINESMTIWLYMKQPMKMGHLTLCFIAYFCESLMTKALREKKLMLEKGRIIKTTSCPFPFLY